MTDPAYSFLPWLRAGIATKIKASPTTPSTRVTIPVQLLVSAEPVKGTDRIHRPVDQPVQLYGPGDVIGVDPRAISRTEPRPWVTNAEPNYLAHIEFYEEDFLWRYSPAAPDEKGRLLPWLALIVLEGQREEGHPGEFEEGAALPGRPLPYITIADPAGTLPNADQLGAWAHVHVNGSVDDAIVSDTERMPGALAALREVLRTRPDNACARLMCPRHLKPNRPYHAFLVPAFETGRLAGLGFDPRAAAGQGALHSSWGADYEGREGIGQMPYYHRWFFGTGDAGDFEYLVRLLQPRKPDTKIARRDVDVRNSPGPGLPGITTPEALGGVLKLGGALRVPNRKSDVWDNWDGWFPPPPPEEPPPAEPPPPPPPPYPHPFQEALAGLINLADAYQSTEPAEAHAQLAAVAGAPELRQLVDEVDPVVTPPLYGKWHAMTSRLLTEEDGSRIPEPRNRNWLHRLNLDPRFRIAANFGTQVVQSRQEEFMAAAWQQVGDVLEANQRIRAAQLAREVGHALQKKHLDPPRSEPGPTGPGAAGQEPIGPGVSAQEPAPHGASAQEPTGQEPTAQGAAGPGGTGSGATGSGVAGSGGRAADAIQAARSLRLAAPASSRVTPAVAPAPGLAAGLQAPPAGPADAVGYTIAASQIAAAPVSAGMRRLTRPGSRLMRTMPFGSQSPDELLVKMDRPAGAVTAAAEKTAPPAVVTTKELADALRTPPPPPLPPSPPAEPAPGAPANGPSTWPADPPAAARADAHAVAAPAVAARVLPDEPPEGEEDPVKDLPVSTAFVISVPAEGIVPPAGGTEDSKEAERFKQGLRDIYGNRRAAGVGGAADPRDPLLVARAGEQLLTGLRSDTTVPKNLLSSVRLPERLKPFANRFLEAMAYPVLDLPMFQSLIDISVDTFVPHLGLIPPNTITLLETDQEFIEAFMAGLNHEMARELLWREYPTDQRGSPFRQFWDPRPALPLPNEEPEERRERLYDITRIHTWSPDSVLGTHDNHDLGGPQEEELVLVIRGELLKKYPTAAVYAHRADWFREKDGTPRPERERVLAAFPDAEHPPPHLVKLPVYEAKVEPDVTLLGFDLTKEAALGRIPDDPGWFFVIKERPGDPRFGADEEGQGTDAVEVWNDLSWKDVDPRDTQFIGLDPGVEVPLKDFDASEDDQEKEEQRREDVELPPWNERLNSADIAYMLFQAPVLIAVHAQEMLRDAAE